MNYKLETKKNFMDQRLTRASRHNTFPCVFKVTLSNKSLNNVIYYFHTNRKARKKAMIRHLREYSK